MTKQTLIRTILDSATSGTQEEAENSIDLFLQEHCLVLNRAVEGIKKEEAIDFALFLVGNIPFPNNVTFYKMGSMEEQLMNLPSSVNNRYELYQQSKNK